MSGAPSSWHPGSSSHSLTRGFLAASPHRRLLALDRCGTLHRHPVGASLMHLSVACQWWFGFALRVLATCFEVPSRALRKRGNRYRPARVSNTSSAAALILARKAGLLLASVTSDFWMTGMADALTHNIMVPPALKKFLARVA